jgi:GT2 family glycosyltransferase
MNDLSMLISVVVPFRNAEATIQACLEALATQIVRPNEIIMVDNCSTDKSEEIVLDFMENQNAIKVHLVKETNIGPSFARNRGVKEATGEIIAFTDSDCFPDTNWLKNVDESFKNLSTGAVAGRIMGLNPSTVIDKFHAMFTMQGLPCAQTFCEFTPLRGGFPTANLAVRKPLLDSLGGFDENMKIYTEDYDLCARIYRAGFCIQYEPRALVYHKHRNTLKGTWIQSFGFGKGHPILLKKHFRSMVILAFPGFAYQTSNWHLRLWLDFKGADKKLLLLIALSLLYWPAAILIPAYFLYLFLDMKHHLRKNRLNATLVDTWRLVFLLIFKSSAISAGRMFGSLYNRVLCI